MKKLTLKQHWYISNGLMFAGLLISTIDLLMNQITFNWWLMGIAIVLAGVGFAYHLIFVRCPECGARLRSGRTKFPETCEVCGADLTKPANKE